MKIPRRFVVAFLLSGCVPGCGASVEDEAAAIRMVVDRSGPRIDRIALDRNLPPRTKKAASLIRPVIPLEQVPATREWAFPPNVFRLDRVEVQGDEATVAGLFGPVPASPGPGVGLLACGHHVTVRMARDGDRWREVETETVMC